MNYLSQIQEFYSRQLTQALSARAQALWYYLLYCVNRARWRQPLEVRRELLQGALSLSKRQFYAARDELVAGGYIIVERQLGNQPSLYTVIDLTALRRTETGEE